MSKKIIVLKNALLVAVYLILTLPGAANADLEAEQTARTLCAGCHGPVGISTNPIWPNLAGQKAPYTALQLKAYRDGSRKDPNMNGLSQTLTDTQIEALAQYYSNLPD